MKKSNKISGGKKMMVGAGMAALGAGAYYLLGPDGKKHQKKASAVLAKVKKEVEGEIKKAKSEWKDVSKKLVKKTVKASKKENAK